MLIILTDFLKILYMWLMNGEITQVLSEKL